MTGHDPARAFRLEPFLNVQQDICEEHNCPVRLVYRERFTMVKPDHYSVERGNRNQERTFLLYSDTSAVKRVRKQRFFPALKSSCGGNATNVSRSHREFEFERCCTPAVRRPVVLIGERRHWMLAVKYPAILRSAFPRRCCGSLELVETS